jgi:hypothetical protein
VIGIERHNRTPLGPQDRRARHLPRPGALVRSSHGHAGPVAARDALLSFSENVEALASASDDRKYCRGTLGRRWPSSSLPPKKSLGPHLPA